MADSSSFIGTAQYQRLWLRLKPDKPCRVAIQVVTSDSTVADTTYQATWPWRAYTGAAGVLNNQADSTVWIETTRPSSVVGGEDEMVYGFGIPLADVWAGPRGKDIAICKIDNGEWYSGQNTRIRLRVLSSSGVVTWTATLLGLTWH